MKLQIAVAASNSTTATIAATTKKYPWFKPFGAFLLKHKIVVEVPGRSRMIGEFDSEILSKVVADAKKSFTVKTLNDGNTQLITDASGNGITFESEDEDDTVDVTLYFDKSISGKTASPKTSESVEKLEAKAKAEYKKIGENFSAGKSNLKSAVKDAAKAIAAVEKLSKSFSTKTYKAISAFNERYEKSASSSDKLEALVQGVDELSMELEAIVDGVDEASGGISTLTGTL